MERTEVTKKVVAILGEKLMVDESVRAEDLENFRFKEDLGGDSLDMIDLIMDIEKEYDIHISDAESYDLCEENITIHDIVDMTMEKVAAK